MADNPSQPATVTQADRDAAYSGPYATVEHRKPVNGARDYFVVAFAGYWIEFHQDEFDLHAGEATNKASACANKINGVLEQVAARSRITHAPSQRTAVEI